jgi:hypothetical protein
LDGKPAVYVCRNFACELPVTDAEKLEAMLGKLPVSPERDSTVP